MGLKCSKQICDKVRFMALLFIGDYWGRINFYKYCGDSVIYSPIVRPINSYYISTFVVKCLKCRSVISLSIVEAPNFYMYAIDGYIINYNNGR